MIRNITIKNFKSIKDLSFDVPKFAVLVGNNAVGKSNILKAIKLISLLSSGKQLEEALPMLSLFTREFFFDPNDNTAYFSINILLNGKRDITYSFKITIDRAEGKSLFRISEEELRNGDKDKFILKRVGEKIELLGEDGGNAINLSESSLALSNIKKPDIISEVQKYLSSIVVDKFDVAPLKHLGLVANINESAVEKNLTEKLHNLNTTDKVKFNGIVTEIKKNLKGIEDVSVSLNSSGILTLKIKEANRNEEYTVFSASDGNLRSLGLIAYVMDSDIHSSIFIDEIENSMHPTRIKSLIKFLEYMSENEASDFQIVVTTHSPIVLKYANPDQIRYVYKNGSETKIGYPEKNPAMHRYLAKATGDNLSMHDLFESGVLEMIYSTNEEDR